MLIAFLSAFSVGFGLIVFFLTVVMPFVLGYLGRRNTY